MSHVGTPPAQGYIMYLSNTLSRGLLNFATPLFEELENPHARWEGFFDPAFAEEDGDYVFEVEMPGFSKEDIKIQLDQNGHLNLEGQTTRKGNKVKFGKTYEVPEKADLSTADASLKNGIFRLTFKRKNKHKPKEIKIK